jgi:chromosome partitioning protein
MGRIYAIANQKGGVGKTTTCLNLGAALAARDRRVLLIDGDYQSNLTEGSGLELYKQENTTYDVFHNAKRGAGFAIQTIRPGARARAASASGTAHSDDSVSFDLIPASPDMAALDLELMSWMKREEVLRTALKPLRDAYDYILIDAPPALDLIAINIFTAADGLIVPLQVHTYALRGLALLQRTIAMVAEQLNAELHITGVVCTMTDNRNTLSRTIEAEVRKLLGDAVYKTTIPNNIRLAEAPAAGLPIQFYDPASTGAKAYTALAEEVDRAQ